MRARFLALEVIISVGGAVKIALRVIKGHREGEGLRGRREGSYQFFLKPEGRLPSDQLVQQLYLPIIPLSA